MIKIGWILIRMQRRFLTWQLCRKAIAVDKVKSLVRHESNYTFFFPYTTLRATLFLNLIMNVLFCQVNTFSTYRQQHNIFQLLVLVLELHYTVLLHVWQNVTRRLVRLLVSIWWFLLLFLILVSVLWYWSESLMAFFHSKDL